MCLFSLDPNNHKKYRVAWKVFHQPLKSQKLYGLYCSSRKNRIKDKWLNEKNFRDFSDKEINSIQTLCVESYQRGWHCYLNKKDALEELEGWHHVILAKVKIKNILAYGFQDNRETFPTIVCEEIFIDSSQFKEKN